MSGSSLYIIHPDARDDSYTKYQSGYSDVSVGSYVCENLGKTDYTFSHFGRVTHEWWSGYYTSKKAIGCNKTNPTSIYSRRKCPTGMKAVYGLPPRCYTKFYIYLPEYAEQSGDVNAGEPEPEMCSIYSPFPIHIGTGNKFLKHTEISPGKNQLGFTRFYNSQSQVGETLGKRWSHAYNKSLKAYKELRVPQIPNPDNKSDEFEEKKDACEMGWNQIKHRGDGTANTTAVFENDVCRIYNADNSLRDVIPVYNSASLGLVYPQDVNVVALTRHNGKKINYRRMGDTWVNDNGISDRLEDVMDADNQRIGYRYITGNDQVEEYDTDGRLISVSQLSGYRESLHYNTDNQLHRVDNNLGQFLAFTHDDNGRIDSMRDQAQRTWRYGYDAQGNLKDIVYPDATPNDDSDNTRRVYHYEVPDLPHAVTGYTDQRGIRFTTYAYDDSGRAVTSTKIGNVDRTDVVYNNDGSRTLSNGRGVQIHYAIGQQLGVMFAAEITGPGCASCAASNTRYFFDANNNLYAREDNGVRTEYGNYDDKGNPGFRIDAVGTPEQRRVSFTYDPRFEGRVATITEPSVFPGQVKVTTYSYDDVGNVTSVSVSGFTPYGDPVSRTTTLLYNGPLHQLSQVDGPRTDLSDVTTLDYYPLDDANVHNAGRLKTIVAANGLVLRDNIQYSATGKVLSEQRLNGLSLSYDYYPGNDRLKTLTQAAGGETRVTRWTYLATGEVETITLGFGSALATTLTLHYDDARRLVGITDGLGNRISYQLDTEGNREGESSYDPNNVLHNTVTRVFDDYDRVKEVIRSDGSTVFVNNPDGTVKSVTDAKGNTTRYDYDVLKRLTQSVQPGDITSRYDYDSQDNLSAVTDPRGNSTGYQVDDLGNVLQQDSPDTAVSAYDYDAAGNITEKLDAKQQRTVYAYDALNRLTQVTLADGKFETYVYDQGVNAQGLLSDINSSMTVTNADGSTVTSAQQVSFDYNGFGQITGKHQLVEGQTFSVNYIYNTLGLVESMTYPSGTQVAYTYQGGKVHSVSVNGNPLINNIAYTPLGQIKGWTWANGTIHSRSYDADGRLKNLQHGSRLSQLGYDANSNIETLLDPAQDSTFGYDALDRLTSHSDGQNNLDSAYDYDANGNRTQESQNTLSYTYVIDPASNRITSKTDNTMAITDSYSYDANGNVTHNGQFSLEYDSKNQLISIDEGNTAWYHYNPLGQRIRKEAKGNPADVNGDGIINNLDIIATKGPDGTPVDCNGDGNVPNNNVKGKGKANGQDTACIAQLIGANPNSPKVQAAEQNGTGGNTLLYFAYDLHGQLLGEYENPVTASQETVYLGNIPVASMRNGVVYTIETDHLNTPRRLVNSSNTVLWQWSGEPFGNTEANEDPDGDGVKVSYQGRFPGQYYDAESELHYNYFRYYDPGTGRYVTSDPIGVEGGLNTYAYVDGNPLFGIDPIGLNAFGGSQAFHMKLPNYGKGYFKQAIQGAIDLRRGELDMEDAQTIDADKYFHCRANCEAAQRGVGGQRIANDLSRLREILQQDDPAARMKDEQANQQGQQAGSCRTQVDCYKACSNLIPPWGIPKRHLPTYADPKHIYKP